MFYQNIFSVYTRENHSKNILMITMSMFNSKELIPLHLFKQIYFIYLLLYICINYNKYVGKTALSVLTIIVYNFI